MTPEELRARFKPKVEPTSAAMGPLYDAVEHAIELMNCAYFAVRGPEVVKVEEAGDAVARAIDDSIKLLSEVKGKLNEMVTWAT